MACPVFNHGTGAVAIWVVITQEHGLAEGKLLLKLVVVAVIATLGCIVPSLLVVSILAFIYYKYRSADFMKRILKVIRPVVVSLIAAAGIRILSNVAGFGGSIDWKGLILFSAALVTMKATKVNPVLIMVACGVIYLLLGIIIR